MMPDCPCGHVFICRYGWLWRVWCWALDVCPSCEQTTPYHVKKCEIIFENDCEHGFSRQTGGHHLDCPVCWEEKKNG